MKKIAIIDFDFGVIGGVEKVAANLANELSNFHQVYFISIALSEKPAYQLNDSVVFHHIFDRPYRLRDMAKDIKKPLADYLNSQNIDVALIMGNYAGYLTFSMRFHTKTKLVYCDHGALLNEWHKKKIVLMRGLSCLFTHKTIVLTKQSKDAYKKKFFANKKVDYIYNWIDTGQCVSTLYQNDSKKFLSAGRFTHEKGFAMLVQACIPVFEKYPDWQLHLFGDGEDFEAIKSQIDQAQLQNHIILKGMCKDLADRYKDYSFYVLPSYREGLPLVLLEAKANRLPIVSFDIVSGPREIVRHNTDGILVAPQDTKALGEAIEHLIENPQMRQHFSDSAHENLCLFSKETILKQWLGLIDDLT